VPELLMRLQFIHFLKTQCNSVFFYMFTSPQMLPLGWLFSSMWGCQIYR